MSSLGKCNVKDCEREAARASIAFLPDGSAVPVVVCIEHFDEGTANYEKLHPKKRRKKPYKPEMEMK